MSRSKPIASGPTLADLGERAFLRELRGLTLAQGSQALALGLGDDAALLRGGALARGLLVTTDAMVEGVHFRREWIAPAELGRKALAVNLSDLAAMGALPVAAFLALSLPAVTPLAELRAFFRGLRAAGREWSCPLGGGDLTAGEKWVLTVTALGVPALGRRVIRRGAARAGDWVYVTGRPGESAAGLEALRVGIAAPGLIRQHNSPTPRLAEAALLATLSRVAMLDISDGVFNDASQLAEASGVAIDLVGAKDLPLGARLKKFARAHGSVGRSALDYFLYGGEDYELLFATPLNAQALGSRWSKAGLSTPPHCIGRVRAGEGVWMEGRRLGVGAEDKTFRHF